MTTTTITACRCCGSSDLNLILDLGTQPPANSLRADVKEALPTFPLSMCRCAACATVQLTETVDPKYLFSNYVWVTGTSKVTRDYSEVFCRQLRERAAKQGSLFVVEVASNDGTFLRPFQEAGDKILGIDPAQNISLTATKNGIRTLTAFFDRGVACGIRAVHGKADITFARNVLPHVPEPLEILQGMADCLKDDGVAAVEFHSAKAILEGLHYDSIYHEHLSYFSLKTLTVLLERAGLYPFDVLPSPISGGSLVVYCTKRLSYVGDDLREQYSSENVAGVNTRSKWQEFAERALLHREQLRSLVLKRGQRLIGYGASARGSTLLNFAGIDHRHLLAIADATPQKQGQWTPGTNLKVLAPQEALALKPDGVLLLAWNFKDEILGELKQAGFKGQVIVPLPGEPHVVEM